MKTLQLLAIILALFLSALLIGGRDSAFGPANQVKWMQALDWTATALGVGLAALSAFRLLQGALRGERLAQLLPMIVAFFAGLALFQRFWSVPIAFAAIIIAWLVVDHLRPCDKKSDDKL
jgi:hypothetical protein